MPNGRRQKRGVSPFRGLAFRTLTRHLTGGAHYLTKGVRGFRRFGRMGTGKRAGVNPFRGTTFRTLTPRITRSHRTRTSRKRW